MTLWKTMLSVGWRHHKLLIMLPPHSPPPPVSVSNLFSRLNNLTFTFGIRQGRRTSRGCRYLRGPHNKGLPGKWDTRHAPASALPLWVHLRTVPLPLPLHLYVR